MGCKWDGLQVGFIDRFHKIYVDRLPETHIAQYAPPRWVP